MGFLSFCHSSPRPWNYWRISRFPQQSSISILSRAHNSALLCLTPTPAHLPPKLDSRKVELQVKNVTSLPSMPRRPQPVMVGSPLELYLRDFTWQLLQAVHVETCALYSQLGRRAEQGAGSYRWPCTENAWCAWGLAFDAEKARVSSVSLGSGLSPGPWTLLSSCSHQGNHPMRGSRKRVAFLCCSPK